MWECLLAFDSFSKDLLGTRGLEGRNELTWTGGVGGLYASDCMRVERIAGASVSGVELMEGARCF